MFAAALRRCGLIAILRGVHPEEVVVMGTELYSAGFRIIEVPLSSPRPFESIRALRSVLKEDCTVGAGTVYQADSVSEILRAGGELVVMPHCDRNIIAATISAGLTVIPGVATPTEAFSAWAAGAKFLKFFPADVLGLEALKAWRVVLPTELSFVAVGGITAENLATFVKAGAVGLGLGASLYKPGMTAKEIASRAVAFVAAWRDAQVEKKTIAYNARKASSAVQERIGSPRTRT